MKSVVAILILMSSGTAFAYQAKLSDLQTVSVEELVNGGATHVTCEDSGPRCVFQGSKYGVQYPGQTLKEVVWTNAYTNDDAVVKISEIKSKGLCK